MIKICNKAEYISTLGNNNVFEEIVLENTTSELWQILQKLQSVKVFKGKGKLAPHTHDESIKSIIELNHASFNGVCFAGLRF